MDKDLESVKKQIQGLVHLMTMVANCADDKNAASQVIKIWVLPSLERMSMDISAIIAWQNLKAANDLIEKTDQGVCY